MSKPPSRIQTKTESEIRSLRRRLAQLESERTDAETSHYLEAELYSRIRTDPAIFDFLQEGSLDGLWYWDLENREHEWLSPRFWQVLGYDPNEKVHRASEWQDLIDPDDLQAAILNLEAHCADPAHPYDQIVRYQHKNGSTVWIRCRGLAIRDENGRTVRMLGAHNDVTQLMRLEREARELADTLEARVAARNHELAGVFEEKVRLQERLLAAQKYEGLAVLAGGVAHDLNNLLGGILGHASLAVGKLPHGHPARKDLDKIHLACEQAAELTAQMLAYSGRGRLKTARIQVDSVVEKTVELVESMISKKATLDLRLAAPQASVEGDVTQIRQVLMNLLTNASEALEERPGIITVATRIVERNEEEMRRAPEFADLAPGNYVFCEVSDTGVGIDDETRRKIFDPFFSTKFTGRGLGLAAVLGIMIGHGGAIRVDSALGRGSCFQIVLPVCAPDLLGTVEPVVAQHITQGSESVLVIDDEEMLRNVAARALREDGFSVILAEDGLHGVENFRRHASEISCVLLDWTMPRLSGSEVLAQLHAIRPEVPVLLTSGYSESSVVSDLPSKPAGFLKKPFTASQLTQLVRAVLAKPR
jgi:PAS domain S-box-containing protein